MHTKNRILFFINSLGGGGAERVLVTLANELSKRGKDVFIAIFNDREAAYELSPKIKILNISNNTRIKKRTIFDKIYSRINKFRNIRNVAKNISPDIVISFITNVNNDVIFSLLGTKIPVIVSEHTNVLRSYSKKTTFYRMLIYPFATAITVLTRHDYNIWKKKYRQVVYMPNPTSVTEIYKDITNREKIVLAVGTVTSWKIKGFDNLLRCWGMICNDFPDWKLCIAGKYNDASLQYLQEIIKESKCKNVEFLGFRRDIHKLMQSSAIFCLSSRVEGLPMVLIEAMNSSCCCVAFDCITGPREIIKNNSGLLVKNQDIEDLAKKLSIVMKDDCLREYYASNAPNSVSNFALKRVINRWQILLDKIKK